MAIRPYQDGAVLLLAGVETLDLRLAPPKAAGQVVGRGFMGREVLLCGVRIIETMFLFDYTTEKRKNNPCICRGEEGKKQEGRFANRPYHWHHHYHWHP